ncbi:MAG: hypothetical protein K8R21_00515 [Leptospira sp.]|nr:hypothetical protein [Leptospira sp.]
MSEEIKPATRVITDKKRIAICGGSLGREKRALIRGQLVDVGITDVMKAEGLWDLITGLFDGQEKDITPFLDFNLAPVRKPILTLEVYDSQNKKLFETEEFNGDEDGFFKHELKERLAPGKYIFHVLFKGIDSYRQYTRDLAHLNDKKHSDITKNTLVGKGKLRILAENSEEYLTTSDIDQTYLATEIDSTKGKLTTLFETPDQKMAIPGMPAFYRKLRKDSNDSPLCFISASPHFFRRTLLATIHRDGIETESLHLKYLAGTVKGVIDKVFSSFINMEDLLKEGLGPAMDRVKKFFGSSYQSLFDQLTYKLTILLQDRLYQPKKVKEILLGDNTESDYFIFSLYQFIIMGEIGGDALEEYLYNLNFLGRDAVTRDNAKIIRKLADECIATHGKYNSVEYVLINMTYMGPMTDEMKRNVQKALPPNVNLDSIKSFKLYFPTEGALGFAIILHSLKILEFKSVIEVATEMIGKWYDGKVVDDKYILSLTKHLSVPDFAQADKEILRDVMERALKY